VSHRSTKAAHSLLAMRDVYRDDANSGGTISKAAAGYLSAASDALSMALLTLGGHVQERGDKIGRAEQARGFLVEAVTSLSRARIYLPGIRTHTLPVLMASERDPEAELTRLHQIATRLMWHNHAYLPARLQARPLAPEEEAQLAVVMHGLTRHARIDRALRYRWVLAAIALAAVGPVLGFPALGAAFATCAAALAVWRFARESRQPCGVAV
jgi:hypothetical protein